VLFDPEKSLCVGGRGLCQPVNRFATASGNLGGDVGQKARFVPFLSRALGQIVREQKRPVRIHQRPVGGLALPIKYDKLFSLLKEKGYTTYKIRKENLIGQGTLTAIKNGTGGLDSKTVSKLCKLLDCQPGDIMEYVDENLT
jgi:putative transcriptional regulator